eukprot:Awhi_evm1s13926
MSTSHHHHHHNNNNNNCDDDDDGSTNINPITVTQYQFSGNLNEKCTIITTKKNRPQLPTPNLRQRVFDKTNGKCYLCKVPISENFSIEHVIAYSVDKTQHVFGNLLPACKKCNQHKNKSSLKKCMLNPDFSLMTQCVLNPELEVNLRCRFVLMHSLREKRKVQSQNNMAIDLNQCLKEIENAFLAITQIPIFDLSKGDVL